MQSFTRYGSRVGYVVFTLCALVLMSLSAFAQSNTGTIRGSITDKRTGEPLPGANVVIVGTVRGTQTDMDGLYFIKIAPGKYTVRASYLGYATMDKEVTVEAGQTASLNFDLAEAPTAFGETIVVVGSRKQRTAVETTVPVDVIPQVALREAGLPELNQALTMVAPSYNASHQTISDGTDQVDPASLRGLGPDQVLVLINGKRRHTSALLNVNGTFGRGTVGTDLNAIPRAAIDHIEVLRDGAAAQYGSDAIAGVINIVLKDQTSKVQVNAGVGANMLFSQPSEIVQQSPDGETQTANVNFGFKIGENGFFNVTGDYLHRNRTNRSGAWDRDIFPGIHGQAATDAELARRGKTRADFSMKTGQGDATSGAVFFNTKVPLTDKAQFYAFGGLSGRKGKATGFYRLPNSEARVNLNVYPNGFLPIIAAQINDRAITAGVKGVKKGWVVDLSATYGGNSFLFNIENTINASLGESSPVSFDAGRLKFNQATGNLDLMRNIDTKGAVKSLTLALGGEYRLENYQIVAGDDASWQLGNGVHNPIPGVDFDTTSTGAPKQAGSQVFPGFRPSNEVNRYRNSISAYVDLESDITDKFLVDAAGRYENYSDFGQRVTGKFSARYKVAKNFNLRGAVSSGFRAPSLHQIWFNNVSTQFVLDANNNLVPKQVLTANNKSSVAKAFGIPSLKEETSVNVSAGFTARPTDNFSITADYYFIKIDNRIVLTSRFTDSDPIVAQILAPFKSSGVGQAQFFANAVDTHTNGVDVVAAYSTRAGKGKLDITAAANFTSTDVQNINIPQGVADKFAGGDLEKVKSTLFNREEKNRLEDALPHQKGNLSVRYTQGKFGATVRGNYFGKIYYKPTNPANDETFDAKVLIDLDISYKLAPGVRWSIGANNLFNTFPDKHTKASNISGNRFIYSRRVTQFGMNGGFYYSRISLDL